MHSLYLLIKDMKPVKPVYSAVSLYLFIYCLDIYKRKRNDKQNKTKQKMPEKKTGGVRAFRHQGHGRGGGWGWGVRGGWLLLAVMKERCITGSCVLYERDREGFTETEVTWKRDSQSEREARQPLESKLRLTPLYSPPFSICKYSTSSKESVLLLFDVILFISYWGRGCWGGKYLRFTRVTQQQWLMFEGKYSKKNFFPMCFLGYKVQCHFDSDSVSKVSEIDKCTRDSLILILLLYIN